MQEGLAKAQKVIESFPVGQNWNSSKKKDPKFLNLEEWTLKIAPEEGTFEELENLNYQRPLQKYFTATCPKWKGLIQVQAWREDGVRGQRS